MAPNTKPDLPTPGVVAELNDILTSHAAVALETVSDPRPGGRITTFATVPEGRELASLKAIFDEFRERPERRVGTATLRDTASFVLHVLRFEDKMRAICFANPSHTKPSFTAIYDYHEPVSEAALPGWLQHRAVYDCRMSDEWLAWQAINGKPMNQGEFAEFLEDRIQDVRVIDTAQDPKLSELVELLNGKVGGASSIMALSRGLSVSRNIKVRNAITLASGEVNVQYDEQHADEAGAPMTTPNLFFIGIPVFYAGEPYRIAVRLRYRLTQDGKLLWSCHLHRPDLVFEDAFTGLKNTIREQTQLVILTGNPEQ